MPEPFPTPLYTERLVIRAPVPEDAPALNAAILETFDQLERWMPWAQERPTLEETSQVIAGMIEKWRKNEDHVLFCFERENDEFIVASGLHPVNLEVPSYHIGYWCREPYQGLGYVTEAVKAIRDAAFEHFHARRLEIRCDFGNSPSQAVALRCGFRLEGTFLDDCRDTSGFLTSTMYFAQTRDDDYYDYVYTGTKE